jgi:hypothetical protein
MSVRKDLDLVSQIMYLREGDINPGDEEKVDRFEKKIAEWQRDVVEKDPKYDGSKTPSKEDISSAFFKLVNNFEGYWCEGEECQCDRSHWVVHDSPTTCWECMHDPCACRAPLVWHEGENAYYRFFLSCDGTIKKNIWMSEPTSDMAKIEFKRKEKKRKDIQEKENEEEECSDNQQRARNEGFCCHEHAKSMKLARVVKLEERERKKKRVTAPDHCIHCDEEPCVFIQIESKLCENDEIYYDKDEYQDNPVAYNSARRKRAYQYAAFLLWEGINYRKPHFTCVEDGVRALFPPFDGKIMGYKKT